VACVLEWYDPDLVLAHTAKHPPMSEPTDMGLLPFRVISPNPPLNLGWPHETDPNLFSAHDPLLQIALWGSELEKGRSEHPHWKHFDASGARYALFLEAHLGVLEAGMFLEEMPKLGVSQVSVPRSALPWDLSPDDLGASQLAQTGYFLRRAVGRSFSSPIWAVQVVVSRRPNIEDFCLFWSLRTMSAGWSEVYWGPCDKLASSKEALESVLGSAEPTRFPFESSR